MAYSNTAEAIEALAAEIGDNLYIDVANWHLYLREAHLHTALAEQIYPLLSQGLPSDADLKALMKAMKVKVGGGKLELSLADLIPPNAQGELLRVVETFYDSL